MCVYNTHTHTHTHAYIYISFKYWKEGQTGCYEKDKNDLQFGHKIIEVKITMDE